MFQINAVFKLSSHQKVEKMYRSFHKNSKQHNHFNIDNNTRNSQHARMISEQSCDTLLLLSFLSNKCSLGEHKRL